MRSLRTISRPVALLALAAWLGAWSAHFHPTHVHPAHGAGAESGHAHAGLDALRADHAPAIGCAVRHATVSADDAHHQHSSTLGERPLLCLSCRSIDEQQLAATRAETRPGCDDGTAIRAMARFDRDPGIFARTGPPVRGPPAGRPPAVAPRTA